MKGDHSGHGEPRDGPEDSKRTPLHGVNMALIGHRHGHWQTLLGIACVKEYEDIAEYLISLPNIDLSRAVRNFTSHLPLSLSQSLTRGTGTMDMAIIIH